MFMRLFKKLAGQAPPDLAAPPAVSNADLAAPPKSFSEPEGSTLPGARASSREAARSFTGLSLAGLQTQRQAVDRQQRQTFTDLQQLQADSEGVVARYASARVDGRPAERQALERVYGNIKARLKSTELRHADQLRMLTLLDRVCVLREDLQARQGFQEGALAGIHLEEMKSALAEELAALLSNRNMVQDLLDELEVHDEDARLQASGSMRSVHNELMALTEPEVQEAVAALLSPLDDVAVRFDQRLQPASQARTGSQAPHQPGVQREEAP